MFHFNSSHLHLKKCRKMHIQVMVHKEPPPPKKKWTISFDNFIILFIQDEEKKYLLVHIDVNVFENCMCD